ncbi:hypothetical protein FNH22_23170 [Fulvivirga sp. M361]|uniref:hypothetical protein n=1 Tax=Fulvivirga sp. M361 TaxID=2594266 RepID=UPI00117B77A8|nr:hypothetical protein [Fulvivirga sp. M361]TRX51858.1 hypothetical protein FNH22_23170 [Fulvivirga sp. M361]
MFRNRKITRGVALFLLLTFVQDIVLPTVSWALTSGPTAPEATSFEPVDTTDMVNLMTGDLVYNIPLLAVPGPGGGYPLSLSYHAGIQPEEEASWVGLGWTLNPGAITRSVSGFPDDAISKETNRFFWEGGERTTASIGVSVGIKGIASVNYGLSISNDTYQGVGIGWSTGFGFGLEPASVSVSSVTDGYGNSSVGVKQSINLLSVKALDQFELSANLSSSNGSKFSTSLKFKEKNSLVSASLSSSQGLKFSSIANSLPSFKVTNSKSGNVSRTKGGFSIPIWIPKTPLFFNIGRKYEKYWIDELESVTVNGSLYYPRVKKDDAYFEKREFDTNRIPGMRAYDEPLRWLLPISALGGISPDYDAYQVNAQGVGGSIRPHIYKQSLVSRSTFGEQIHLDPQNAPVAFRFLNEFSNKLIYDDSQDTFVETNEDDKKSIRYSFNGDTDTGDGLIEGFVENNLAGSKSVVWFSNDDIINTGSKVLKYGFKETVTTGFERKIEYGEQIGAFQVTNESGVTYHFSLPAYNKEEYFFSENRDDKRGDTFNELTKSAYAYTWYLTAITGPDYVDRGTSGRFDDRDWGYWVEFEYGLWSDQYYWRNPGTGLMKDDDSSFENFSSGTKELYYLDAIRTATHTALFIKDIRDDAKSSIPILGNRVYTECEISKHKLTNLEKSGRYRPFKVRSQCASIQNPFTIHSGEVSYYAKPTSTMRLKQIVLIKNQDLNNIAVHKDRGDVFRQYSTYQWQVSTTGNQPDCSPCDYSDLVFDQHKEDNVLDVHDLTPPIQKDITNSAINAFVFNTDYSLVPGTPNSFSYKAVNRPVPSYRPSDYTPRGKLTLNSIQEIGYNGSKLIPPTYFSYSAPESVLLEQVNTAEGGPITVLLHKSNLNQDVRAQLEQGVIIKYRYEDNSTRYARISKEFDNYYLLEKVGYFPIKNGKFYDLTIVKDNLPYEKDISDEWGLYKEDPTQWSLKTIKNPLGGNIKINYEPDDYSETIFDGSYQFPVEKYLPAEGVIKLKEHPRIDLENLQSCNDSISLLAIMKSPYVAWRRPKVKPKITGYKLKIRGVDLEQKTILVESNSTDHSFVAGHVAIREFLSQGGGIRVKDVSVELDNGFTSTTHFSYARKKKGKDNESIRSSSGYTFYRPDFNKLTFDFASIEDTHFSEDPIIREPAPLISRHFRDKYKISFNYGKVELFRLAKFVPGPGVMYTQVEVRESRTDTRGQVRTVPGFTRYQYSLPREDMVSISIEDSGRIHNGPGTLKTHTRLTDFTSEMGRLLSVVRFTDEQGNNKLTETTHHYFESGSYYKYEILAGKYFFQYDTYRDTLESKFGHQGFFEETFSYAERKNDQINALMFNHEVFPVVKTGSTVRNYKSGIVTDETNIAFDFYSGKPTKIITSDGYGNKITSESTPAYHFYPGMGLSVNGGKNMLVQSAQNVTYKSVMTGSESHDGLVSSSIQTWSDHIPFEGISEDNYHRGIWRKHTSYYWNGDELINSVTGLYPMTHFRGNMFNWNSPIPVDNPQWQKNVEITLTDVYSTALETKDINGNYNSLRKNDQEMILAYAHNASYEEMAYSGVESLKSELNLREGGVHWGQGIPVVVEKEVFDTYMKGDEQVTEKLAISNRAHSGKRCLKLTNGTAFLDTLRVGPTVDLNKPYRASVWIYYPGDAELADNMKKVKLYYKTNSDETGHSVHATPQKNKSGSWYQLNLNIYPDGANELYVGVENNANVRSVFLDDFRLHPMNASMACFNYDEKTDRVTDILDEKNFYTHYEYDGMGRLIRTSQEAFNFDFGKGKEGFKDDQVLEAIIYNFKTSQIGN